MRKRKLWIVVLMGMLVLAAGGCGARGISAPLPPGAELMEAEEVAVGAAQEAPASRGAEAADMTVERLVIRTANLDLVVADTEEAIEGVQALARELGGYVVSLNTRQYQEGVQANVTLRVPAESFDEALEGLRDLATTVQGESISGRDVTEEYVNLDSRLRHLQAKEEQLLEFLDEAEDTEAVLAVYEHLSATQQEIERVTGQIEYMENQADLATVTVSLTPDALAQPLEVGGWNLPGTLRDAIEALLSVVEVVVKGLIYFVIVMLPTLVFIALPIAAAFFLVRWLIRRSRARK
ncbi:MAG: DUF4349 domain-containing protein [Anaerolineae bacterium]